MDSRNPLSCHDWLARDDMEYAQAIAVGQYEPAMVRLLKPVSPDDLRFAAEYFLNGQGDWTIEERTEAAILARHLTNLAGLMGKRAGKSAQ